MINSPIIFVLPSDVLVNTLELITSVAWLIQLLVFGLALVIYLVFKLLQDKRYLKQLRAIINASFTLMLCLRIVNAVSVLEPITRIAAGENGQNPLQLSAYVAIISGLSLLVAVIFGIIGFRRKILATKIAALYSLLTALAIMLVGSLVILDQLS